MSSDFDFDCPSISYNIATNSSSFSADVLLENENWFKVKHDHHESKSMKLANGVEKENSSLSDNVSSSSGLSKVARVPTVGAARVDAAGATKSVVTVAAMNKKSVVRKPAGSMTKPQSATSIPAPNASKKSRLPVSTAPFRACTVRPTSTGASSSGTCMTSGTGTGNKNSIKRPRDAVTVDSKTGSSRISATALMTSAAAATAVSKSCDDDMLQMLKTHNKQTCASSHTYEPAMHSVRDVRKWEKSTGSMWSDLKTAEERTRANAEIHAMKKAALAQSNI